MFEIKNFTDSNNTDGIALIQMPSYPGPKELRNTAAMLIEGYRKASEIPGVKTVVAPEGVLGSYMSMDGFYDPDYLNMIAEAQTLLTQHVGTASLVYGSFCQSPHEALPGDRPHLYNSALTIQNGQLIGRADKIHLPNYSVFDDRRWFAEGDKRSIRPVKTSGAGKLGIHICEDLWEPQAYGIDVLKALLKHSPDILLNLSASPFEPGKIHRRFDLAKKEVLRGGKPFAYVNQVGCYDGCEGLIPFDGQSFLFNNRGALVALGDPYATQIIVGSMKGGNAIDVPKISTTEEIHNTLIHGIREYFRSKNSKAVIGISGGVDSALVAALAVEALGAENVVGVTLPTQYNSEETISDSYQVAKNLGMPRDNFFEIPIGEIVDKEIDVFNRIPSLDSYPIGTAEENLQARQRMKCIMYVANRIGAIALNTGNRTELVLDNMTIYGDMMGGFSVLGGVDKDQIYDLCRFINQRAGREVIPYSTIDRVPSAELKPDQDDSMVMGAHPVVLAPMIRDILNNRLNPSQALQLWGDKLPHDLIESVFEKLYRSQWKMYQAAPAIRLDGGRGHDRRFPMTWSGLDYSL